MFFCEYGYSAFGLPPESWNPDDTRECCRILARKVTAGLACFQAVARALLAFPFLEERKIILDGRELAQAVEDSTEEIIRISKDPANLGIAKAFVVAANPLT